MTQRKNTGFSFLHHRRTPLTITARKPRDGAHHANRYQAGRGSVVVCSVIRVLALVVVRLTRHRSRFQGVSASGMEGRHAA